MVYSTQEIINKIDREFIIIYKNASKFKETTMYDCCIEILSDYSNLKCISFANDFGIPPAKSIVRMLYETGKLDGEIKPTESQGIGSLMGFLFKHCLNYRKQRERVKVDYHGVKSATKFYDVDYFTIVE